MPTTVVARRRVVTLRGQREDHTADLHALQEALEETPQWKALVACNKRLTVTLKKLSHAETTLRETAIRARRGGQPPTRGVQVKTMHRLLYNAEEAYNWALDAAPDLISQALNVKAFEKAAPGLPGAPIRIVEELKAFIDTDLSKSAPAPES